MQLTCQYCNWKWRLHIYSDSKIENKCNKCGDTNITVKELNKTRVDAYQGCPPFEEKKQEIILDTPSWPHWLGTD